MWPGHPPEHCTQPEEGVVPMGLLDMQHRQCRGTQQLSLRAASQFTYHACRLFQYDEEVLQTRPSQREEIPPQAIDVQCDKQEAQAPKRRAGKAEMLYLRRDVRPRIDDSVVVVVPLSANRGSLVGNA